MKKQAIIARIAQEARISSREADETLEAITDHIMNALARGESVNIVGFGAFVVKSRKPREGRNPATGAIIKIPETHVVSFKPGKGLKSTIE